MKKITYLFTLITGSLLLSCKSDSTYRHDSLALLAANYEYLTDATNSAQFSRCEQLKATGFAFKALGKFKKGQTDSAEFYANLARYFNKQADSLYDESINIRERSWFLYDSLLTSVK